MKVLGLLSRVQGTTLGLAVLGLLVVIDISADWILATSYVVAPLLTAVLARPSRTALVAVLTLGASCASVWWDDVPSSTVHGDLVRAFTALGVGLLAVLASAVRAQREGQLSRMTRVAAVAQEALLPHLPQRTADLRFATRYVSATSEALLGGDFYDLAQTQWGTRLVIGDVRGKGLDAVQRMVTVVAAFRQSVRESDDLTDVARRVDGVVRQVVDEEDFVTALFVEFDESGMTLVNCGHHPPLLVDGQGPILLPAEPVTLPLGMGGDPLPVRHALPDARMLLYTDGLVEARARNGSFFPLLGHADVLAHGDLDEALGNFVGRLLNHTGARVSDDVALVLVQREPALLPAV